MATQITTTAPSARPSALTTAQTAKAGKATLLLMGFVLLSRVLGVVRDMVLAHVFGQNKITDVYTAAFRVPDILYLLVAGGALATVFVPVFAEFWNDDRQEDAWRTFGTVVTVVALVAALLVVGMEFAAVFVTRKLQPLFTEASVLETARLSRILLPAQWCFFVGGLMMGTLNARKRFIVPALGPVIYNMGIILGGLLFHRQLGLASMAYGAVFGAFAGNFLLPAWELKRADAKFYIGFDVRHPGVVKVGRLMLPALIGLGLSPLIFWVTQQFLPDDGSISALRNAYTLTQAPIGIFAQASAIVLFPTISLLAARKNWDDFRREISSGIRQILFLTIPASLLMAVLAEPIIATLFVSDLFGPDEVARAAAALRWYSLGTFAWSAQAVLGRGFYAMQDVKTPVIISTSMLLVFSALCFLSARVFDFGYLGLAVVTSLVATLNMLLFYGLLQKRVGGLDSRGMASSAVRIVLAAGGASFVSWLVTQALLHLLHATHPARAVSLLLLAVAGGLGLVVYAGLCFALRVPELKTVRAMFRRNAPAGEQTAP